MVRNMFDNRFNDLTNSVASIIEAGGRTTPEYDRILARWQDFHATKGNAQADLNAAIVGNATPEEIADLRAQAYIQQAASLTDKAAVSNSVEDAVLAALTTEYKAVAAENYETFRDAFNDAAASFTETISTLDPDTPPLEVVNATAAKRKAWGDAPVLASKLDTLAGHLEAAAVAAGVKLPPQTGKLGLVINAPKAHRRRVWEAWETTTGNTGKWGALIKAGATIEAPALQDFKPYAEPAEHYTKQIPGPTGGIRQIVVDPEDEAYAKHQKQEAPAAA